MSDMTNYGPKYLICGSRLSDDRHILRCLLEGLQSQGRQWQEIITIMDNGSLQGLGTEVEPYRFLEHRRVEGLGKPNVVLAFMDRLSHNRDTENLLILAETQGIPAFVISRYDGQNFPS